MDLDQLLKKAELSGVRLPKKLLQQRQEAQQDGENEELEAIEEQIQDALNQQLYDQSMEMRRQLDAARRQRGRCLNMSRDGIARSDPPEKQARSRICHCEICRQPIALIKDPKNITAPFKPDDFIGVHHDRDPHPPFHPSATWQWMRCWWCGNRPWNEPNKILVSDGFFVIPEKSENKDVEASTQEESNV